MPETCWLSRCPILSGSWKAIYATSAKRQYNGVGLMRWDTCDGTSNSSILFILCGSKGNVYTHWYTYLKIFTNVVMGFIIWSHVRELEPDFQNCDFKMTLLTIAVDQVSLYKNTNSEQPPAFLKILMSIFIF